MNTHGYVLSSASLAFLWFLWTVDRRNEVWRNIVLAGWVTRAITISALLIRIPVAIQSAACTSMLVSVAIEHNGLMLSKSAAVSSIRYLGGNPHDLLFVLWRGVVKRRLLSLAFLSTLVVTAILSQLVSAVLLSDLKLGVIPGNAENSTLYFGLNKHNTLE